MSAADAALPGTADAVIIGAGIVGAATAAALAATGRRVCVIDRGGPFAGTTGAGEGNILVSDHLPGPGLSAGAAQRHAVARVRRRARRAVRVRGQGRRGRGARPGPAGRAAGPGRPAAGRRGRGDRAGPGQPAPGRAAARAGTGRRRLLPAGLPGAADARGRGLPRAGPPSRRPVGGPRRGDRARARRRAARRRAWSPTAGGSPRRSWSTRQGRGAGSWPGGSARTCRCGRAAATSWSPSRCRRRSGTRSTSATTWPRWAAMTTPWPARRWWSPPPAAPCSSDPAGTSAARCRGPGSGPRRRTRGCWPRWPAGPSRCSRSCTGCARSAPIPVTARPAATTCR